MSILCCYPIFEIDKDENYEDVLREFDKRGKYDDFISSALTVVAWGNFGLN
jgi:hypothetical protein